MINYAIAERPADMTITTHVCRGNFRSTWISSGGYEPVAETLLAGTNYDGYFLEYDSERAGGFEPLRYLPKGNKIVVVGVITSKSGALEKKDDIKRRLEEAAQIRAAGSARGVAAMRLCLHRRRQHPHRGRAVGQAEARGRCRERGVGEVDFFVAPLRASPGASRLTDARRGGSGSMGSFMTANPDAIIVGAGPAGLACAMTMRAAGLSVDRASRKPTASVRSGDAITIGFICTPIATVPVCPAWRCRGPIRSIHRANRWSSISKSYAARFDTQAGFQYGGFTHSARRRAMARGCGPRLDHRTGGGRCDRHRRCAVSSRPGRDRRPIRARSCTAATIAIPRRMRESACWSSDLAIRAARSPGSGERRRRCRARGSKPGSGFAARSPGISDPDLGDFVPALAGASGRSASTPRSCGLRSAPSNKLGLRRSGQGAAPDGRRGRTRAVDRHRHAGPGSGTARSGYMAASIA